MMTSCSHPPHFMMERELKAIRDVVSEQVKDEGLWFVAKTAPEAYLQQELRRLHTVIEHKHNA